MFSNLFNVNVIVKNYNKVKVNVKIFLNIYIQILIKVKIKANINFNKNQILSKVIFLDQEEDFKFYYNPILNNKKLIKNK